MNYAHAYLIGALMPTPLWLLLFYLRKDLRREMLIMSVLGGCLAIIFAPAVLHDYWHPQYLLSLRPFGGIEDFIYTFFLIGVASVIYEEIFAKKCVTRQKRRASFSRFVAPAFLIYVLSFYLPFWFGLQSLFAALFSSIILIAVITLLRHDLFKDALISGLFIGLLVLGSYIIFLRIYPQVFPRFFDLNNFSGIYILEVPLEELLWAFGLGAAAGPVYEFFAGLKFKN